MSATELTPLEELQAAHKRLSELAAGHNNGHIWMQLRDHAGIESACADGPHFIADVTTERTADLIVTLHRTIDAQLAIMQRGIALAAPVAYGADTSGRVEHFPGVVDHFTLVMARAINGRDDA